MIQTALLLVGRYATSSGIMRARTQDVSWLDESSTQEKGQPFAEVSPYVFLKLMPSYALINIKNFTNKGIRTLNKPIRKEF